MTPLRLTLRAQLLLMLLVSLILFAWFMLTAAPPSPGWSV